MKSLRFNFLFPVMSLLAACSGSEGGSPAPTPGGSCSARDTYTDPCAVCSCVDGAWSCDSDPCPETSPDSSGAGGAGTGTGGGNTGGDRATNGGGPTGGSGATVGGSVNGDGSGGATVDGCTQPAPYEDCRCSEGSWACSTCTDDLACGAGSYCKAKQPEGNCSLLGSPGSCQTKPQACSSDQGATTGLVCGCDNKSYPSECEAAKAGVNVKSEGECPKQNAL